MLKIFYKKNKKDKLQELDYNSNIQKHSWIFVANPTKKELQKISQDFLLDIDQLQDALDYYEVPRFDWDNDKKNFYFFIRYPVSMENKILATAPMLIILSGNLVLTIVLEDSKFLEIMRQTEIDSTENRINLMFQIIDSAVNKYNKRLIEIHKKVRKTVSKVRNINNQDIEQLVNLEYILNDYLSALLPMREALYIMLNKKIISLDEAEKELTEDLLLDTEQIINGIKNVLKSIQNIRDSFSTIIGNKLNQIMKTLAALTVILTVPTIISSIYGMNIKVPLMNSPYAFWEVSSIAIIGSFIIWALFAWKDWI